MKFLFFLVVFVLMIGIASAVDSLQIGGNPSVVSTFNSAGIYVNYSGDDNNNSYTEVYYKKSSESNWKRGHNLYAERQTWNGYVSENYKQFRGSIVELEAEQDYDLRLDFFDSNGVSVSSQQISFSTWDEVETLIENAVMICTAPAGTYSKYPYWLDDCSSDPSPFVFTGGSSSGYVVYRGHPDGTIINPSLDATPSQRFHAINLDSSQNYIIFQNFTFTGSENAAVKISGARNVILDGLTIYDSGGDNYNDYYQFEMSSVYIVGANSKNIVVQNSNISTPAGNACDWVQCPGHSKGGSAIWLDNTGGGNVIRYNYLYGTASKRFEDVIGGETGSAAGSATGGLNKDSDIYGNYISGGVDDQVEIEGDNVNIRFWNNFVEANTTSASRSFVALVPTIKGPVYIWDNVFANGGTSSNQAYAALKVGAAANSQESDVVNEYGVNRIGPLFVYHNVFSDIKEAISNVDNPVDKLTVKNNIYKTYNRPFYFPHNYPLSIFDYDLSSNTFNVLNYFGNSESNGIIGIPVFNSVSSRDFRLRSSSPGIDDGTIIYGFTNSLDGSADIGAYQEDEDVKIYGPQNIIFNSTIPDGGDTTPPVIGNINSFPTINSVTINHTTDENSNCTIQYGLTTSYGSLTSKTTGTIHSKTISGLNSNTLYHYKISCVNDVSLSSSSSDKTFNTLYVDVISPNAQIISPLNQTYSYSNLDFAISSNENSTAKMNLNSGQNYSMSGDGFNFNYSFNLSNGNYVANFFVEDYSGNVNSSSVYFSVNVSGVFSDETPPNVQIISPLNQNYNSSVEFSFLSNENSTGYFVIEGIAYFFVGDGYSLNRTLNLSEGNYSTRFYIKDSSGNVNDSQSVSFSVSFPEETQQESENNEPVVSNTGSGSSSGGGNTVNNVIDNEDDFFVPENKTESSNETEEVLNGVSKITGNTIFDDLGKLNLVSFFVLVSLIFLGVVFYFLKKKYF